METATSIYLTTNQVLQRYGIGKTTLWRWHSEKDFPKPDIASRPNKFKVESIEQWEKNTH